MKKAFNILFIREIVEKIIMNLQLIFQPILINGFIFFDKNTIRKENWGDDINYFFIKEISQKSMLIYSCVSFAMRFKFKNYLVIGSTIDMCTTNNTEVWGAGIIDGSKPLKIKPSKVHAVRGPMTRDKLLQEGVDCPEIYGDPALLLPLHYKPKFVKEYRIGWVPHRSNLDAVEHFKIDGIPLDQINDMIVIDLSNYDNWTDVIDLIVSCDKIISSSLHGLIVAEAYGVPNLWVEFGMPLIGGHFKFHDFFQSIGVDRAEPYSISDSNIESNELYHKLATWTKGELNLQPLINSAPFPIRLENLLA